MGKYFSDVVDQAIADIYYCYDSEKARRAADAVFQAAKNDNDPDAYYILSRCFSGNCYSWDFHPFSENREAAYTMLCEAITRGSAMAVLGAMRMDMLTPALQEAMPFASIKEAWEAVKEKADAGCLFCQYMIGNTYYFLDIMEIENISEKDFPSQIAWRDWLREQLQKSLPYFESAYRGGMGWGGRNLVNYYKFGEGDLVRPKEELGLKWERIGADLGYPDWQYKYAVDLYYHSDGKKEEGYQYALKAAEGGHLSAWEIVGDAYWDGQLVPKDRKKAVECYEKAGDLSDYAKEQAGRAYFFGTEGVPQDYARAVQRLLEAFRISDGKRGRAMLGVCYLLGLGCTQNAETGRKLLEAAEPSSWRSYGLGMMYAEGIGVKEDIARGVELLKDAAKKNYAPAQEALSHYKKSIFGVWRRV